MKRFAVLYGDRVSRFFETEEEAMEAARGYAAEDDDIYLVVEIVTTVQRDTSPRAVLCTRVRQ